jgi:hypothetical protein
MLAIRKNMSELQMNTVLALREAIEENETLKKQLKNKDIGLQEELKEIKDVLLSISGALNDIIGLIEGT